MWIVAAFALAGGLAQLVDGTLGMGFGVTSATALLFMGVALVTASAARSAIGTLSEDRLAVSDSPAELRVFTPNGDGRTHETRLAVRPAPAQPFHRQLADAVLSGEPMDVTPEGSKRNIAVMQAATLSAAQGGRPVPLPTA